MKTAPIILSLFLIGTAQAADKGQFKMSFKVMEAPEPWITENGLKNPPLELGPGVFEAAARGKNIDILSAPQIISRENEQARIEIKESSLSYMVKTDNGYEVRELPEDQTPGLSITAKASRTPGKPGQSRLESTISIATLEARTPIPGLNLDVGKPIINKQEISLTTDFFDTKWYLVSQMAPLDKGSDRLVLIFAQVSEVKPEAAAPRPNLKAEITADEVNHDAKTGAIHGKGHVKLKEGELTIYADELTIGPKPAKGPAIQADALSFESPEGRIRLEGHVRFRTAAGQITADKLVIDRKRTQKTAKANPLEEKLKAMVIPSLELREVALTDAVDFLTATAKELDPAGKGVNFIMKRHDVMKQIKITMSLRQVPLLDAIRYIAEVSDIQYKVDTNAVILY